MATKEAEEPKFRIIIHGNNGFKSTELISQMEIPEENNLEEFEFFPFSDINLNNRSSPSIQNAEMLRLTKESYQGVEVSAILVLISLTEIFSEGMRTMIQKLPHSQFYGYNQKNENEWWKHVIIVFSFGDYKEGNKNLVMKSIARNGGIKQIVTKAGNRYIWTYNSTKPGELVKKLRNAPQPMKKELILGVTHLLGYEEMVDSFSCCLKKSRAGVIKGQVIHRRFILFGDEQSKSSLGNLLLGTSIFPRAKGLPMSEADVCGKIAYGNKLTDESGELSKVLKIQVVDHMEGLKPKLYGKYLANCISDISSDHLTFLITINLNSEPLSQDEFTKINDAALILATRSINFYSNSIIVFTDTEELVDQHPDNLEEILKEMLQRENHAFLRKIIKLVQQRYIFLNTTITDRDEALEKIFLIANQIDEVNKVISKKNPELITTSIVPIKMKSTEREGEVLKNGGFLGCISPNNFRRK